MNLIRVRGFSRYHHIFVFVLLLALLGGCAYYNTLFNAKRSYNDGMEEIQENPDQTKVPQSAKKHFETTIEKCWKLIEIYTDENKYADDALLYICKSEFHLAKYAQSKLHLEQFMGKYPDSDLFEEAQLWYAKILLNDENIEEASEYFRKVVENAEDASLRAQASFELGLYSFEQQEYAETIEHLNTALQEDLDDENKARLLFYLGEANFIQANYEDAIEQYKKVQKLTPTLDVDYRSRLNMATCYTELGKNKDAYEILRKMLTAPRFRDFIPYIKTAIGTNYEKEDQMLDALDTYKEVVDANVRGTGTATAAFKLATLYEYHLNNIDSAVAYYGKVERLDNKHDSLEIAKNKKVFLGEFKTIRDEIKRDMRLVDRLTNDESFRDSLYTAQYEDSLARAMGLVPDSTEQDSMLANVDPDSLRKDPFAPFTFGEDSLSEEAADSLAAAEEDDEDDEPDDENAEEESGFGFRGDESPTSEPGEGQNTGRNQNDRDDKDDQKDESKPLELRKLPEIEFDLMNRQFELAEFYLLKVEEHDSASKYYNRFLATYEDSILTPKALYSLLYIDRSENKPNAARIDSLENAILFDYAESEFALEIRRLKGEVITEDTLSAAEVKAQEMFLAAESLYYAGHVENAIVTYKLVANLDTTKEISAKAQYAAGYIYEFDLVNVDSAEAAYQAVVDRYPNAKEYVNAARRKLTIPPDRDYTIPSPHILAARDSGYADEGLAEAEKIVAHFELELEDIIDEKIRWRMRRDYGN